MNKKQQLKVKISVFFKWCCKVKPDPRKKGIEQAIDNKCKEFIKVFHQFGTKLYEELFPELSLAEIALVNHILEMYDESEFMNG